MRPSVYLVILFAGAFCVRFGVTLAFRDIHQGPTGDLGNDDVQFHQLAIHLVEGHGYRVTDDRPLTSFRAPGHPFVMAGLYWVTGVEPAAAHVLFAILGAIACVFTYLLAREVLTETGARLVGVFMAIYLPHAYQASTFNSETVYVVFLALGLWMFVRYVYHGQTWTLAIAGAALGYATLTRPGALLMLPLLLGALAWRDYREKTLRPMAYLWFGCLFVGVIAPWTVRNYQVHGRFVLVATNGGTTFWGGNNDRVLFERKHVGYWVPSNNLPNRDLVDAAATEIERDDIEWRLGKEWVSDHVAWMPLLWLYKFGRLWWLPDYGEGLRWLRIITYVPFLLLFALYGVRMGWRRAAWSMPWLALHLSTLALYATVFIFCGEPRFRDAHTPVLMIYAVAGLSWRFWR